MSAAISCTRAAAPRLAIRTLRCQRYASTQAADAISERREMIIETAPIAKVATPTPATKGHKNTRAPTLAERMHKALYPHLYVNGRPIEGVELPKERKAKKAGEERKPRSTSTPHTITASHSPYTLAHEILASIAIGLPAGPPLTHTQTRPMASKSSPQLRRSRRPAQFPSTP